MQDRFTILAARVVVFLWVANLVCAQRAYQPAVGKHGGRLVIAQRSEPRGFQPLFAVDEPSRTIIGLLHAPLIRINSSTHETEGVLAESWTVSRDGREIVVRLRDGLTFSDRTPLTVDDVLFTFSLHLDPTIASPQQDLLRVGGKPVRVERKDGRSVRFLLDQPYALGERLVAGVAILPRHRLASLREAGSLRASWTLNTPPAEIAGAGPFRLKSVQAGQRIVLERNPAYFKKDRNGKALPYLDEIEFISTAGEDAQVARLLSGEADLISGFGGSSFQAIENPSGASGGVIPSDGGPSLDYTFLLFNLNPDTTNQPSRRWFEEDAFRKAVSLAVDRASIARLVYRGRASAIWGPVTPARGRWFAAGAAERRGQSLDAARETLKGAGFGWDAAGNLVDAGKLRVRFTILANSSNPAYSQTGAILEEDLKKLGIEARVVPMEFRSLVDRVLNKRDYDTAIMALRPGEVDPSADMNAFVSQGRTRLWNLSGKPSRQWEGDIDRLMRDQMATRDIARRKSLFGEVQGILATRLPMVCLVSPNVLYAARTTLRNLQPGVIGDIVLWNADELYWDRPNRR